MYWQKQVAGCALSLAQHAAVGAAFPTMAGAHGVSCVGAHVVAAPAGASASRLAAASAARNSATRALLAAMLKVRRSFWSVVCMLLGAACVLWRNGEPSVWRVFIGPEEVGEMS
mgnify:CR=1 FL=1